MITSIGKCKCGEIEFTVKLPEHLGKYSPRSCDCDFCISRNISYLSHPKGKLNIKSFSSLEIQKQGSNQADFITCTNCKSVIAVSVLLNKRLIGSLNSTLLLDSELLKEPTIVSPKLFTPQEKLDRWELLWLPITVNGLVGL